MPTWDREAYLRAFERATASEEQRQRELAILERQSQLQGQQLQQKMIMDMLTGAPKRELLEQRLQLEKEKSEAREAARETPEERARARGYSLLEKYLSAGYEPPPERAAELAAAFGGLAPYPEEATQEITPGRFEPITLPGLALPESIGEGLRPREEPLGQVQRKLRAVTPLEGPQPIEVPAEKYIPPVTREVKQPLKLVKKLTASERQATLAEGEALAARAWAAQLGLSPDIAKNITDVDKVAKIVDRLTPEQIQAISDQLLSEPDIDPAVKAAIKSGNPALVKTALVQGITATAQAKQALLTSRLIEERSKRAEKRAEGAPPSRREMENDLQKARKDLFEAQEKVVDKETFSRAFPAKAAELQPRVDAAKKVRDEYQKIVDELETKLGIRKKSKEEIKPKLIPPLKSGATRQSRAKQLETAGYKAQEILDILKKEIAARKYK